MNDTNDNNKISKYQVPQYSQHMSFVESLQEARAFKVIKQTQIFGNANRKEDVCSEEEEMIETT